jgi:glutathione S-transferase
MGGLTYIGVAEARGRKGLRLVLTQGIPAPWGMAARVLYEIKKIPFVAVTQAAGAGNEELVAWTGHNSAPVAMYDDERPRALWSEQLMLAERLSAEPPLIPADQDQRAEMIAMCHEICAEDGLGWNLRNLIFEAGREAGQEMPQMIHKYGSGTTAGYCKQRVNQILGMLGRRLEAQRAKGRQFLVGDRLSAADIYWTAFSNLMSPMADELVEVPDYYKAFGVPCMAAVEVPVNALFEHRDRIACDYFDAPLRF